MSYEELLDILRYEERESTEMESELEAQQQIGISIPFPGVTFLIPSEKDPHLQSCPESSVWQKRFKTSSVGLEKASMPVNFL